MHFIPNEIYHVYNRGNEKRTIFFNASNYIFFIKKVRDEWKQHCEIICYCIMPNHFHFMLVPNEKGCWNIKLVDRLSQIQNLS
jgi:putative transposase